ncbi:MAG: glycine dehydrogenase subunit 2, partial [Synergistaceae bacterium]|nr:glycine dehydrogenase subunit 2 [Synergistaceae bacterium]
MDGLTRMKRFHQARWNEPIIYQLSEPGQRGVLVPGPCCDCASKEEVLGTIPEHMVRKDKANLPEVPQLQLVRHYNHLSQGCIGVDGNID